MAEAGRRLFLALWPEPAAGDRLHELSADAQKLCGGRRMRRDTLHLTLAFLGEVEASRVPLVVAAMAQVRAVPFRLAVDTLGYWKHNHIVWAGCRAWPASLDRLVLDIRAGLAAAGLSGGGEMHFFPHVTLLRKACSTGVLPVFEAVDWPVREWVLVESSLSPAGPEYRRLVSWPLA